MRSTRNLYAVLVVVALLLSACAKPTPKPTFTTLHVIPLSDPYWDTLLELFEQREPQIRIVEVTPEGAEGKGWRLTAGFHGVVAQHLAVIEAGEVDLFPTSPEYLERWVDQGKVLALDTLILKHRFDLAPYGRMIDSLRLEGALYELPIQLLPMAVYYDRERFAAASLASPEQGWTWEQFRHALARLTQGEGEAKLWGFADITLRNDHLVRAMVTQQNPESIDPKTAQAVLQYWGTVAQLDKVIMPYPTKGGLPDTEEHYRSSLGQGRAAVVYADLTGHVLQYAADSGRDWALAPVPVQAEGDRPQLYTDVITMGISAGTREPEAAWRFLSFLAGPEAANVLAHGGTVPAYRSDETRERWLSRTPPPPAFATEIMSAELVPMYPRKRTSSVPSRLAHALNVALMKTVTPLEQYQSPWETEYSAFLEAHRQIQAEAGR